MLEKLTSADFGPYVNQTFSLQIGSAEPLGVELIDVSDLGTDGGWDESSARRPFSIVFRGPKESYLPQSIYRIEHHRMGSLDLFLVPIGPDSQGMRYEAVFY